MCGTEKFVKETFNIIKEKLNIESGYCYKKEDGGATWYFEFSALHDIDRLIDWLYKDATVYLERKRIITERAKEFAARHTPFIIPKDQLKQDYKEIGSIKKIARKYKVDADTIKNRLVKFGIEHRTTKSIRKAL